MKSQTNFAMAYGRSLIFHAQYITIGMVHNDRDENITAYIKCTKGYDGKILINKCSKCKREMD